MDIVRILTELRSERHRINEAISVLERMGSAEPRGRGSKWMKMAENEANRNGSHPAPKKYTLSDETRKKMAEGQRKRRDNERAAGAASNRD